MSDNPEEPNDELLDSALDMLRAASIAEEAARVERLEMALGSLNLTVVPPPWWGSVAPIALVTTSPRRFETRSSTAAEPLLDTIHSDLPPAFDAQVNIISDGNVLEIELEADPSIGNLWAAITIAGEPIVSEFLAQEWAPRLRRAMLPLPAFRPVTIEIVQGPSTVS